MADSNFWLDTVATDIDRQHPDGEVVVSSGVSPSGAYHVGTLREVLTAEAVCQALKAKGRTARHIHVVDDLDVFRKVPTNLPVSFEKYLGWPLCDIPSPDDTAGSYADFFLNDLLHSAKRLNFEMEIVRSHEKYQAGFFVPAIEQALASAETISRILTKVSGHKVDENWSPIQVVEGGYLKNRRFISINTAAKTLVYADVNGQPVEVSYRDGQVKLNWRVDWPARWWLMAVDVEPFGRDHATIGGSYDTGSLIVKQVFKSEPPIPIPYHFINRSGETKKMSKSAGNIVTARELTDILPAELVWYFMLRLPPRSQLFFDEGQTVVKLFDDFSALLAKTDKSPAEQSLVEFCLSRVLQPTVSPAVPFTHLLTAYQAGLKDSAKALEIIARSEYAQAVESNSDTLKKELKFIDIWLERWAPDEYKFSVLEKVEPADFDDDAKQFLAVLADKIEQAPKMASGDWFHQAIYSLKDELSIDPESIFQALYRALIGRVSGPRAGWFLATLDKEWLVKRLRFQA
ncbi:MAG TPA: lysine--tRNA ligase [Candidatus Saccharimonadales bacterium]